MGTLPPQTSPCDNSTTHHTAERQVVERSATHEEIAVRHPAAQWESVASTHWIDWDIRVGWKTNEI